MILTLGQAFEVAYQIALKDKIGSQAIRSQSANQLSSNHQPNSGHSNSRYPHSPDAAGLTNACPSPTAPNTDAKSKPRSKSIPNPNCASGLQELNSNSTASTEIKQAVNREPSPKKSINHSPTVNFSTNNNASTKLLASHGRSHSVNDIKINGNKLKLAPQSVDEMGLKDLKPGSRAPIALSEEL